MAYQTGTANNLSDLLSKLATFAQTLGWVVDKLITGTQPGLFVHNAHGYWSTGVGTSLYDTLYISGNTGFDTSVAWNAQPGTSMTYHGPWGTYYGVGTTNLTGPFTSYDFFGTPDYLHVVVQISPGRFRHFGIGILDKEGDYTGGHYAYGTRVNTGGSYIGRPDIAYHTYPLSDTVSATYNSSYYTSIVRADGLGTTLPHWFLFGSPTAGVGAMGSGCSVTGLAERPHPDTLAVVTSQSQLGAAVAPVPNAILGRSADGLWRRLGVVPDYGVCRMSGIAPRSRFSVNGDDWMIVPAMQLRDTTNAYGDGGDNSHLLGYAYRIVA